MVCALMAQAAKPAGWWAAAAHKSRARQLSIRRIRPGQLASGQTNKSTTFLRCFQKSAGSGNCEELYGFLPCFAEPAFAAAVVVVFTGVRFLPVVHQWLAAMG